MLKKMLEKREHLCYNLYAQMKFLYLWGRGAAGSALPWHGRGRGFKSHRLHQYEGNIPSFFIY